MSKDELRITGVALTTIWVNLTVPLRSSNEAKKIKVDKVDKLFEGKVVKQ